MIGILLLLIAICLYITGKRKYSLLLFISFSYSGLRVLTDNVLGAKNINLAIIYTCVICIYTFTHDNRKVTSVLDKWYKRLLTMVCICCLFSYFHYEFSFFQILQGGRSYLILLSFYFLKIQSRSDIEWVIKSLFYVTFITAILYIFQVILKIPLLPYGETKIDPSTGILRMYNEPTFLVQFIYLTCIFPEFIKNNYSRKKIFQYAPAIFIIALMLTQSRMFTFMSLAFLGFGLLIKGELKKVAKYSIIIAILMLPLASILSSRIKGGNTGEDLKSVFSGKFKENLDTGKGFEGSLSYRFAWVYERMNYLSNRPLTENLFGLGIISESQVKTIQKWYNFRVGIQDNVTGYTQQLGTPDIIYGSFLTSFGYLGGALCLLFWVLLCKCLYLNNNKHPFIFSYSIYLMFCFIASFTGGYLIFKNLVLPFSLLSIIFNRNNRTMTYIKYPINGTKNEHHIDSNN